MGSFKNQHIMSFIEQAYKGENEGWRYLLSFIAILIGWLVLGSLPILIAAVILSPNEGAYQNVLAAISQGKDINANLYLVLMISSFAIGMLALFLAIRWIHQRHIPSLFTSRKKFDWKRLFFAFWVWFLIAISLIALDYYLHPKDYIWNYKPFPFLVLVLISLILLPIQTSFEEVFFRGYLMQGVGILFRNKWLPFIFTSIVFGLLHAANPEVEKLGPIVMIYYIGTGFLFGITTLVDEGLELSLGMHAANNIVAAVLVTSNWTVFQTDALLIDNTEPNLGLEMYLPVFVIYPILLYIFSKKYQWNNWKEKLFGTVRPTTFPPEDKSPFPNQQG